MTSNLFSTGLLRDVAAAEIMGILPQRLFGSNVLGVVALSLGIDAVFVH